jgi:ABC-2 type transport system permease protein
MRGLLTTWNTALAFLKRDFLVAVSYKSAFVADVVGILFKVITFFYIGEVFGGAVSPSLESFAGNYFAFLIIGIALTDFVHTSLENFATSVRESQMTGTLEIVLLSPIRVPHLLVYSSLWAYLFTTFRFVVYVIFGASLFTLDVGRANLFAAATILLLTILCYAPLGILSATVIMVFKQGTWFRTAVSAVSFLLGGVAYPVTVLPGWIQSLSFYVPMTHSVNGMRQALLNGQGLIDLRVDALFLAVFAAVMLPLSLALFGLGLERTKKMGTLTQY